MNAELIKALRYCADGDNDCGDACPFYDKQPSCSMYDTMIDAADAIERLQSDLAKKDSQLTEWKNAWRIANSLYKSAQAEIDEHRAYQHGLVERIEQLKAELSVMKQKEQTKQEGDTNQ